MDDARNRFYPKPTDSQAQKDVNRPCFTLHPAEALGIQSRSIYGVLAEPARLLTLYLHREHSFKPVEQDSGFDRKDPNLQVPYFMFRLEFKIEKQSAHRRGHIMAIYSRLHPGYLCKTAPVLGYFCQWGQRVWPNPRIRGASTYEIQTNQILST